MHLHDLKRKTPADLVVMAEELGIENASTLRKQDIIFAILKATADAGNEITGTGTIEVMPDGFGFLRSPDSNYLAGPDDVYVTPQIVRKFGLRTGDTIEGEIRGPRMVSAISAWCASLPSISTIPKWCATASISTI